MTSRPAPTAPYASVISLRLFGDREIFSCCVLHAQDGAETRGAPAQGSGIDSQIFRWRDFMIGGVMRHYKDLNSVVGKSHGLKMAPGLTGPDEPPAERFFVWPG